MTKGTISFDDGGGGDTASSLSCTNGVSIGSCDESKKNNLLSYQNFAIYAKIKSFHFIYDFYTLMKKNLNIWL